MGTHGYPNTGCSPSKKPRPNWIKCHLHLADVKVPKACTSSDEPLLMAKTAKIMGSPRGKLRFEGEIIELNGGCSK